jgi:hypothetical protein
MTYLSILNQIFYPNNKFDDSGSISNLNKWMLFCDKMERNVVPSIIDIPVAPIIIKETRKEKMFSPKKEDTLFWCAYVAHHGEAEYWEIGNRYKNVEIEEKQKIIDYIKKNPVFMKKAYPKITNVKIQEIMSELMLNKKTSFDTFSAICLYYQFQAIIINNKTYFEMKPNLDKSEVPVHLLQKNEDSHFSYIENNTFSELKERIKDKLRLENDPHKPLKSISSYKMEDLKEMATVLKIQPGEKWKKADYYENITEECK